MNCKYCYKIMDHYLHGYSCSKYINHTFIIFDNGNSGSFYFKINNEDIFISKNLNVCKITYDNFDDEIISKATYEDSFNIKTKEQLDQWLIKVNKEIVFQ